MADEQQPQPDDPIEDAEAADEPSEQPGVEPASEPEDRPGESAARASLPPEVAALLGAGEDVLGALAAQAGEVFLVGLESTTGQRLPLLGVEASLSDYATLEAEFADVAHMGFEVRLMLPADEPQLIAALMPLEDLGALLALDLDAAGMADDDVAAGQVETIGQSIRELLDLVSITLFSDQLDGVEATLAAQRVGHPDLTLGVLAEAAHGATPLRLDLTLGRPDGGRARLVIVLPYPVLVRVAALLGVAMPEHDAQPYQPIPLRPLDAGDGFGIADDPNNLVSLRPDGRDPRATGANGPSGTVTGDDVDVHPVRFPPLSDYANGSAVAQSLDLIMDVSMRVTVELGRSTMTVEEVLAVGPGSVVELNKLAGEPVDILVNDQLIARGEVVVVDENFGVRVTEIVSPRRRMHALGAS